MNYAFPIIQWLALSHTVCNPVIYCWMNSRFRAGFRSAIANVPILKKLTLIGSNGPGLQRMNTCTTYTFASGHGKLVRNSSLMSNGRTTIVNGNGSPVAAAPFIRNFSDGKRRTSYGRTSRSSHNTNLILNSPGSSSPTNSMPRSEQIHLPTYTSGPRVSNMTPNHKSTSGMILMGNGNRSSTITSKNSRSDSVTESFM